jgi:hypothetical protein
MLKERVRFRLGALIVHNHNLKRFGVGVLRLQDAFYARPEEICAVTGGNYDRNFRDRAGKAPHNSLTFRLGGAEWIAVRLGDRIGADPL